MKSGEDIKIEIRDGSWLDPVEPHKPLSSTEEGHRFFCTVSTYKGESIEPIKAELYIELYVADENRVIASYVDKTNSRAH